MGTLAAAGDAFKNYATGAGSIGTAVAVFASGIWAYRRFRRTPESRPKITLDVAGQWLEIQGNTFLRAVVTVMNEGGLGATILQGWGQDDPSRLGFFALGTSDDLAPGSNGKYVDWSALRGPKPSAPVVPADVELLTTEIWTNPVLFRLPDDSIAALLSARIWIKVNREYRPYSRTTIVTSLDTSKIEDT